MEAQFVTISDVEKQLGMSRLAIRRKVEIGELPPYTIGCGDDDKVRAWHVDVLKEWSIKRARFDLHFPQASPELL